MSGEEVYENTVDKRALVEKLYGTLAVQFCRVYREQGTSILAKNIIEKLPFLKFYFRKQI
jgi:hypothetical protein